MAYNIKGEQRNTGRTHFKPGFTPWNKGKTGIYSEEHLRQIGDTTRARLLKSHPQKNKPRTPEERIKISEGLKAIKRYGKNLGYPSNWKEITERVFQRDNYECQECGVPLIRIKASGQAQCHHIDYNTANFNESNLITLCASCHGKTGFNREDWMIYFRSKLSLKQSL